MNFDNSRKNRRQTMAIRIREKETRGGKILSPDKNKLMFDNYCPKALNLLSNFIRASLSLGFSTGFLRGFERLILIAYTAALREITTKKLFLTVRKGDQNILDT